MGPVKTDKYVVFFLHDCRIIWEIFQSTYIWLRNTFALKFAPGGNIFENSMMQRVVLVLFRWRTAVAAGAHLCKAQQGTGGMRHPADSKKFCRSGERWWRGRGGRQHEGRAGEVTVR